MQLFTYFVTHNCLPLTFLGSAASSTGLNVCPWCLSPSLHIRHTSFWSVSQNSLSISSWSGHTSFSGSISNLALGPLAPVAATFLSLMACCSVRCSFTASTMFLRTRLDRRSHIVYGRRHSGHSRKRLLVCEWLLIHCLQNVWSQSRLTGSVNSPKHTEHWICLKSRESIAASVSVNSSVKYWFKQQLLCPTATSYFQTDSMVLITAADYQMSDSKVHHTGLQQRLEGFSGHVFVTPPPTTCFP